MSQLEKRLRQFNDGKVADMIQLKYKAMAENMFRFYRGTCHLFYEDLSKVKGFPESPLAWMCGDLHLENFGSYRGDNRLVYFDLNDFDEAALAPALWEIVRLATSILLAFEILDIEQQKAENMVKLLLKSYARTLQGGKANYIERKTAKGIVCTFLGAAGGNKQKKLLTKRTEVNSNRRLLKIDDRKHFALDHFLKRELMLRCDEWIINNNDGPYNFRAVDAAFRLAGTGSVGLKRYIFLLQSTRGPEEYLLVDMKQAIETSLYPYLEYMQPEWESHAQRIVSVQQRMQNVPPALLSTLAIEDESYIIQELQPEKDSIDFKLIRDRYRDIYQVIDDMAMLTASSQLRSTGRQGSATADELIDFAHTDKWQDAILEYALKYATRVKADYEAYKELYTQGAFK